VSEEAWAWLRNEDEQASKRTDSGSWTRHRIRCRSGAGAAGLRYADCVRAIRAALPRDAIAVSRNINPEPAANRDLQRRTA